MPDRLIYPLLRPLLFKLDPEAAHHLTLSTFKRLNQSGLTHLLPKPQAQPKTLMGLTFPNPVGLAAGLDKDGECIDAWAALGFGFIEIGTVTPRPQAGNPKPRLFRLPEHQAILNRMGFNNQGVDALVANVQRSRVYQTRSAILGINIGKNAATPIEEASADYLHCLEKVYPYAHYITVNISSPNTKNLRQLQGADELDALLGALKSAHARLADQHARHVPLVLKIAPDMEEEQVKTVAAALLRNQIDGVIATNTTLSRTAVAGHPHAQEAGGLSGAPLLQASNQIVRSLRRELGPQFPIIGAGGILSGADAHSKMQAGADLVQLYSGLIYRGTGLIREVAQALREAQR